mmetsp:Transcript_33090/g.55752  ORF Transcript_33090/g.55752 Transcript_33090/m.55752 type:complete len:212 (+) Transcript_33090:240-875(+)
MRSLALPSSPHPTSTAPSPAPSTTRPVPSATRPTPPSSSMEKSSSTGRSTPRRPTRSSSPSPPRPLVGSPSASPESPATCSTLMPSSAPALVPTSSPKTTTSMANVVSAVLVSVSTLPRVDPAASSPPQDLMKMESLVSPLEESSTQVTPRTSPSSMMELLLTSSLPLDPQTASLTTAATRQLEPSTSSQEPLEPHRLSVESRIVSLSTVC